MKEGNLLIVSHGAFKRGVTGVAADATTGRRIVVDRRRVAGWPDVFAMRRQAGLFGLELIRPAPRPGGGWTLGCLTVPANPMSQATPRPSPSPCHPDPAFPLQPTENIFTQREREREQIRVMPLPSPLPLHGDHAFGYS
jgi:hypothetical protein